MLKQPQTPKPHPILKLLTGLLGVVGLSSMASLPASAQGITAPAGGFGNTVAPGATVNTAPNTGVAGVAAPNTGAPNTGTVGTPLQQNVGVQQTAPNTITPVPGTVNAPSGVITPPVTSPGFGTTAPNVLTAPQNLGTQQTLPGAFGTPTQGVITAPNQGFPVVPGPGINPDANVLTPQQGVVNPNPNILGPQPGVINPNPNILAPQQGVAPGQNIAPQQGFAPQTVPGQAGGTVAAPAPDAVILVPSQSAFPVPVQTSPNVSPFQQIRDPNILFNAR
ncbi:MAG: hypothetical protein LRZ84_18120 [Desertifilum sp.]|nr:hypothetical protein [Desertifilum sp.]